ncbi:hypothetical protein KUF83_30335 [Streptomyces sp. BV286]|uniref:helix-turn-helix domain-containing protein n=1 Tax=Streptomyces sp. BV286 TaxID=2849672 RepID=UPI001C2F0425|nr:helix-turn-helix domain-containing protein [Streptomyces sp. BV286]MBV1940835.1 hypothetical protein [Streptomyces sp. BV286]
MTKISVLPTRGRPTRLHVQMINRIAKSVQEGKTRGEAAASVGVPLTTLQRWITLGRKMRENGGASTGLELLSLRLVVALEVAERKRRAIDAIMSDEALGKNVPEGKAPIGRPALLNSARLEAVTRLCQEGRLQEAAEAAGVDKRSVLRWLARGRQVHAAGGATTEYERLCGILHARVETAQPLAVPPVLVPAPQAQGGMSKPVPEPAFPATEVIVGLLVRVVRAGATRTEAAKKVGISYRTFARWLALGARVNESGVYANEHERLCGQLRTRIEEADAAKNKPAVSPAEELRPFAPGGLVSAVIKDGAIQGTELASGVGTAFGNALKNQPLMILPSSAEVAFTKAPASGGIVTGVPAVGEGPVCDAPVIVIGSRRPGREVLRMVKELRFWPRRSDRI